MKWQWSVAGWSAQPQSTGLAGTRAARSPFLCGEGLQQPVLIKTHSSLTPWCLECSCLPSTVSFPGTHCFFQSKLSTSGKQNKLGTPNTFLMSTNWCLCWWDLQKSQAWKGASGPQGSSKCWHLGTACLPVPCACYLLQTKPVVLCAVITGFPEVISHLKMAKSTRELFLINLVGFGGKMKAAILYTV